MLDCLKCEIQTMALSALMICKRDVLTFPSLGEYYDQINYNNNLRFLIKINDRPFSFKMTAGFCGSLLGHNGFAFAHVMRTTHL